MHPGYISLGVSFLILVVSVTLYFGRWQERSADKSEVAGQADRFTQQIQRVRDEFRQDLLARLYLPDGTSIYMPRQDCRENRGEYTGTLCRKLDEIKAESQRRHEEYMQTQQEHLRRHEDITEFMGTTRRFMREMDARRRHTDAPADHSHGKTSTQENRYASS